MKSASQSLNKESVKNKRFVLDCKGCVLEAVLPKDQNLVGKQISACYKLTRVTTDLPFSFSSEQAPDSAAGIFWIESADGKNAVEQTVIPEEDSLTVCWRELSEIEVNLVAKLSRDFKEEFLRGIGSITHDFNNVLSVAMGHSELVNIIPDQEKKDKHFKQAIDALGKIRTLLKQVLIYRHHLDERGQNVYDLTSTLNQCAAELKEKLPENLSLEVELNNDLQVNQSRQRMHEVFKNILNNASEAFEEDEKGKITLTVKPSTVDFHRIIIADNGRGMSEATLIKVFEPFFSTHPRMESAGVGLPLVKGILQETGGHIDIQSSLGNGTEVTVYIPRHV